MNPTMILILLTSLVLLLLLPQQSSAAGLKRLRRNQAVLVPDLNPNKDDRTNHNSHNVNDDSRDAGFEKLEEELEDMFFNEVFRQLDLDASMSLDMSYGHIGGGGSSGGGSSGSGGDGGGGDGGGDGGSGGDDGSSAFRKCGVTMQRRSDMLLDVLSTISDRSMLEDMSTSHYYARYWLDKEDGAMVCPNNSDRVLQRYRVALLYFQFGGDNWDNCRAKGGSCYQEDSTSVPAIRFLDESHECLWFGLTCNNVPRAAIPAQSDVISVDEHQPIISVDISDNSLRGDLFDELFGLTELQELTLDGNKGISGTIPDSIGQLTSLMALDIDDNALVGTLPDSLYTLTKLEAIDLNSNSLRGTISNDIGNLKNLVVVQLDNNEFDGDMPEDGLLQLEALAVWTTLDNDVTGSTENVCEVIDQRREQNQFPGYLQFFWVDCLGNPPQVECSCCECQEPQSPTSF